MIRKSMKKAVSFPQKRRKVVPKEKEELLKQVIIEEDRSKKMS